MPSKKPKSVTVATQLRKELRAKFKTLKTDLRKTVRDLKSLGVRVRY